MITAYNKKTGSRESIQGAALLNNRFYIPVGMKIPSCFTLVQSKASWWSEIEEKTLQFQRVTLKRGWIIEKI